jgi:hypothetical protein
MAGDLITYAGMTHIGLIREKNEDSYAIDAHNNQWPLIFIVCDGLGGHRNGELASKTAVEYAKAHLRTALPDENDPYRVRDVLEDVMQKTNVRVYLTSLESQENFGMGTTMTLTVFYERSCYVAHIGDSRCYLYRDNKLDLLTEDDTYVHKMVVSGSITENESTIHPLRQTCLDSRHWIPVRRYLLCKWLVSFDFLLHHRDAQLLCRLYFLKHPEADLIAKDMNRIAVPHNFKVHLHGSLSLAGFVVVHKLRKEKMRGDGDIAFLNNFSAVSLGLIRVRPDISPIRRADINEFVHIKNSFR